MDNYNVTTAFVVDYKTFMALKQISRQLQISCSDYIRQALAEKMTRDNCRPDVQSENE